MMKQFKVAKEARIRVHPEDSQKMKRLVDQLMHSDGLVKKMGIAPVLENFTKTSDRLKKIGASLN